MVHWSAAACDHGGMAHWSATAHLISNFGIIFHWGIYDIYIYKTYTLPGNNTTELQHFFSPFTFLMIISVIYNINKSIYNNNRSDV